MNDEITYRVVSNQEKQYSIWPADKTELPVGWVASGPSGTKQECLEFIENTWTDMRPLGLRKAMKENEEVILG